MIWCCRTISPRSWKPLDGGGQTGVVGAPLDDSLVVRVVDAAGEGVAGVEVRWGVNGGGSVSPETSTTDADGLAAAQRVLGAEPGAYGTTATASAQGSPVVFLATAVAAGPSAERSGVAAAPLSIKASTGSNFATMTVTVRDGLGNPVPGVSVTLSATGAREHAGAAECPHRRLPA